MNSEAPKLAWVYAGRHYGCGHRILAIDGTSLTLIHEPSDDVITVHRCDVEFQPSPAEPDLAMTPLAS